MPSLKDLKTRIDSVKNTRKITSAMKMVAGAKLRRAQEQAEAARPYAEAMAAMLGAAAAAATAAGEDLPKLLRADIGNKGVCVLAVTADRGLCGAFNTGVIRETRRQVRALQAKGETVTIFAVGRKGHAALRREFPDLMLGTANLQAGKRLDISDAANVKVAITGLFEEGKFDRCIVVYNRFKSAMTQVVTTQQLLPVTAGPDAGRRTTDSAGTRQAATGGAAAITEFEPDAATVLADLLPRALTMQVYGIVLETMAGFYGAQMTAMDSATRNAGDMINRLTLVYNRTRQAYITKELIEIISGAEAV